MNSHVASRLMAKLTRNSLINSLKKKKKRKEKMKRKKSENSPAVKG